MRCRCDCYDWRNDPAMRHLVAGLIESAFTTECLIFRKVEWISDCGFLFGERLVEIPRNYQGKQKKLKCFSECLSLLDDGWENELAKKNYEMMKEFISKEQVPP